MSEQDLTSTVEALVARMSQMQTELDSLKGRAAALPQPEKPITNPKITSTRRKTLKRLGAALLGGAAVATAASLAPAQAKIIANPGTSRVGAIITSPATPNPTGSNSPDFHYGLVALTGVTAFNLGSLPLIDTGVYGNGVYGIYGTGDSSGVYGKGGSTGVYGNGDPYGVFGNGATYGVYGTGSIGAYGIGTSFGVYGTGTIGVEGYSTGTSQYSAGVYGESNSGTSVTAGVIGKGPNIGSWGICNSSNGGGAGIYGSHNSGGYSGIFDTSIRVAGYAYAGAKPFKIDHPLDPENKYLHHVSVESPDMKNLYDGVATLDETGEATVSMPDWFEALNFDFRYQLTCLGQYAPVFIAEEIEERKFTIAGGAAGQRVSWQVTGIRQDAWAKANPIPVEEEKSDKEKGLYLHPEAFGKSEEMSVNTLVRPKAAK